MSAAAASAVLSTPQPPSPSKEDMLTPGWAMDRVFGPVYAIRKNSCGDYVVAYADSGSKTATIKVRGAGKISPMQKEDTPLEGSTCRVIMEKVSLFTTPSPTTPIDLTAASNQEKKATPPKVMSTVLDLIQSYSLPKVGTRKNCLRISGPRERLMLKSLPRSYKLSCWGREHHGGGVVFFS